MANADGDEKTPVSKRARGGGQEIPQDASAPFPDDGGQQQRGGSIVNKYCQKSFPFNFCAPRLHLEANGKARIVWQSRGQIIADHKEQMVKSIGKDNRTSLFLSLIHI